LEIVYDKRLSYTMQYITNGYFLNKQVLAKLMRYGLNEIMVTLDGIRSVHDERRPLKGGGGTHDVIMNNLKDIAGMMTIFLRINIDKNNLDSFPAFLDELEENGLREKIAIVLNNTSAVTDACYAYKDNTFNIHEYSEISIGLYELLLKRKFKVETVPNFVMCQSISHNGWCIYANGEIYKCMNDFGHESECIGNVRDMEKLNHRLAKWLSWDPFLNSYCKDCNILPLCQGGCPGNWINSSENIGLEERCLHWKHTLPRMLRLHYDNMHERRTDSHITA